MKARGRTLIPPNESFQEMATRLERVLRTADAQSVKARAMIETAQDMRKQTIASRPPTGSVYAISHARSLGDRPQLNGEAAEVSKPEVSTISSQAKTPSLCSWKEIATYLSKGVRTVQRWEGRGLPVRRLGNGFRAPVLADPSDIDLWLPSAQKHKLSSALSGSHILSRRALRNSIEHGQLLRKETASLWADALPVLAKLITTIEHLESTCKRDGVEKREIQAAAAD